MTIKEIAEQAGVSIGTVDRVLHSRGGVNRETERRIRDIARLHGYAANPYARNLKLGKRYLFSVIMPFFHLESNYWELVHRGIEKAAGELRNLLVLVDYHLFDRREGDDFSRQVRAACEREPDALLIAPPGRREMESLRAMRGLPPVCLIDSEYPAFKPVVSIAQNPYRGGFVAGKISKLLSGRRGAYLVTQVHPDAYNSSERERGFRDSIMGEEGNEVIDVHIPSQEAVDVVLDAVFSHRRDIVGVFTTNSITSKIGSYLERRGLRGETKLVGYDLVPENRKALEDGTIDCIISQRPAYQGYSAIHQLYQSVVLSLALKPTVEIPIDIFFRENLVNTDE